MSVRTVYIGDSVYAGFNESAQLVLWLDNGAGSKHVIYIEPEVFAALQKFVSADDSPWNQQ